MFWKNLSRTEYVAYFEYMRDGNRSFFTDRIAKVVGQDCIGSRPLSFGRFGSEPIYHPAVQDINGHVYGYQAAYSKLGSIRGPHPTKVYALRHQTLKNLLIPNPQDNHYYQFQGFCTYNNSNMYPKLNGKDLVYVFKNVTTGETVNLSCFMAHNKEFPTMVEFFGPGMVEYLLIEYGNCTVLDKPTTLIKLEEIA